MCLYYVNVRYTQQLKQVQSPGVENRLPIRVAGFRHVSKKQVKWFTDFDEN